MDISQQISPKLLESIYEEAVVKELTMQGFKVGRQVAVPVFYKGELLKDNLRLDIIIDNKIILELKSVTEYRKLFEKQLYTYLRLTNCPLGYVVNFNENSLRNGIHTVRNHYADNSNET